MNYSVNLIKIRDENHLTQEQMANILGIARVTYTHFESQYDIIPLKYLDIISRKFNVSIDYLLGLSKVSMSSQFKNIDIHLFSIRLKEFRKSNRLTQEKLALLLNTSHSTITGYEKERCLPKTSFLYAICEEYHISADYLLGKVDSPKYLK